MKKLRIEARIRNNRLWHLAHDNFGSVRGLCRAIGNEVSKQETVVGKLLNLTMSPLERNCTRGVKGYRKICHTIADFAKTLPEDLFPLDLYHDSMQTQQVVEVGLEELTYRKTYLLEDMVQQHLVTEQIEKVLSELTERQAEVLRYRYGLGVSQKSLSQTGQIYGVTQERIRQIEKKAMRRLRQKHPELKELLV